MEPAKETARTNIRPAALRLGKNGADQAAGLLPAVEAVAPGAQEVS